MFDPNDYFKIIRNRTVCPVHGNKDRNLEIKRHRNGDKWVFNCYSHNCSIKEIALAAGFNPQDIYDHKDETWTPRRWSSDTGGVLNLIKETKTRHKQITIEDKVEATFGPNPCTNLHLVHQQGDNLHLQCDSKRCQNCGPRKQKTMELQLKQSMGELAYIQRIDTRLDLDLILMRLKKQTQRSGDELLYQVTGDDQRQYILITNIPSYPEQRKTSLQDWLKRIIHSWLYTDSRIRRSRAIGRLSLVHLRRKKGQSKTPSVWSRYDAWKDAVVGSWDDWLAEQVEQRDLDARLDYEIDQMRGSIWS